jgi:hypothetical membrane protein
MRAINHALTGAIIGFLIGEPLVAIPVAVASHFVCDAIPHFGPGSKKAGTGSRAFEQTLILDALLCLLLVGIFAFGHQTHWLLASICAFGAASPDFMWIKEFIRARKRQKPTKPRGILWFHHKIQWFERPIGGVVEIVWAITAIGILSMFVR